MVLKEQTLTVHISAFDRPKNSIEISDTDNTILYSECGWEEKLLHAKDHDGTRTIHTSGINGTYANFTFYGKRYND